MTRKITFATVAVLGLAVGYVLADPTTDLLDFSDQQARTAEFIRLYDAIELTPEREQIKHDALSVIPARCCADNSAYTCCCPCNLSRSVWGLAAWLITERGADADTVRAEVERWYDTVNPDGFPGDTCYTGGCGLPFAKGGCGGMHPSQVAWGS